jgi:hypothetical protein
MLVLSSDRQSLNHLPQRFHLLAIQTTGPKLQRIGCASRNSLADSFGQTQSVSQPCHDSSKETIAAPGWTHYGHLWSRPAKTLPISSQTNRAFFAQRDNDLPHAAFLQFQCRL